MASGCISTVGPSEAWVTSSCHLNWAVLEPTRLKWLVWPGFNCVNSLLSADPIGNCLPSVHRIPSVVPIAASPNRTQKWVAFDRKRFCPLMVLEEGEFDAGPSHLVRASHCDALWWRSLGELSPARGVTWERTEEETPEKLKKEKTPSSNTRPEKEDLAIPARVPSPQENHDPS